MQLAWEGLMPRDIWDEYGCLAVGGACSLVGGLLWTGLYGVPHNGAWGFALFVAGVVAATILVGLLEGSGDPGDGPPEESAEG